MSLPATGPVLPFSLGLRKPAGRFEHRDLAKPGPWCRVWGGRVELVAWEVLRLAGHPLQASEGKLREDDGAVF